MTPDSTPRIKPNEAEAEHTRMTASLIRLFQTLDQWASNDGAKFEIRNIETGESAPSHVRSVWSDGTSAYRAARKLGPGWQVFRSEEPGEAHP